MKRGVFAVSGLMFLQCFVASAQQTLSIRGALSIGAGTDSYGNVNKGYGDITATVGTRWTLYLGGADPNTAFTLCGSKDYQPGACLQNFGHTDQYGNWTFSGAFDSTTVGNWTEWIQFPSGAISNRIAFAVGSTFESGRLLINGNPSAVLHVGQSWTLSLTQAYGYEGRPFDLCGETNGNPLNCTLNAGTVDATGSWTLTGTFPNQALGGWSVWLRFSDGTGTNRAVFTVDNGPLDNFTCESGTIYPIGPNAGFANFERYMPDWYPANSGDYTMNPDRPGGVGNTLEYLGCKSANYVWLQWAYGGLATFAVRTPWGGQTDRGLQIGDSLARFQALYPAAHHPIFLSGLIPLWPSDLDVWDNGPIRVAFRSGTVAMIQVQWWLTYPTDDQQSSTDLAIGPIDLGLTWP